MRNISEYINEARAKSGPVEIEYTPKDRDELINAIREVVEAQSRRKVLDFNCIDTSAIDDMNNIFYLSFIGFPSAMKKDFLCNKWNVSNVKTFQLMFFGCEAFTGKGLDKWNVTNKCKELTAMFRGCKSLREIDMSGWNLESVESIRLMCYEATNLQRVIFPKKMSSLKKVDGTFAHCEKMSLIQLPQSQISAPKRTSDMFYKCGSKSNGLVIDNLRALVLPKTADGNVPHTCSSMFRDCGIERELLKDYINDQGLTQDDMELLGIDTEII